jgi:hypothetical protein
MGEARAGDAAAVESRLFVFQDEDARLSLSTLSAVNVTWRVFGAGKGRGLGFGGTGQSQISGTGEVLLERREECNGMEELT